MQAATAPGSSAALLDPKGAPHDIVQAACRCSLIVPVFLKAGGQPEGLQWRGLGNGASATAPVPTADRSEQRDVEEGF